MTKEQAIAKLKAKRECIELDTNGNAELCDRNCGECKLNYEQGNMGEQKIALEIAIKALEQQTIEDCVSRQAIITMTGLSNWFESSDDYNNFVWELGKLPPVTPTFPSNATNYDVLKAVFGNTSAFRIKDTMEFEKGFEHWFFKPYKRGSEDGSN